MKIKQFELTIHIKNYYKLIFMVWVRTPGSCEFLYIKNNIDYMPKIVYDMEQYPFQE